MSLLIALLFLLSPPPAVEPPGALTIYLTRDGEVVPVQRAGALSGDPQTDAAALLAALLAGPTAPERVQDLTSPLPTGAALAGVAVTGDEVTVDLRLPSDFLHTTLDPALSDAIVDQVAKTLHPLGLRHLHLRATDAEGRFLPLSAWLPALPRIVPEVPDNDEPLPDRLGQAPDEAGQPPVFGQGQPQGALSGKTAWLSAGHGWYWSETLGRWTTQRGNNYGLVEDFANAEAVNYYLARYLWNAGAAVWLVRERAMTEEEVIVDNDGGAPAYTETGTWLTSSSTGFGGTYRWTTATDLPRATATWTPDLPAAGWYAVWAWYRHGTNRPTDARYEIHHTGGVTTVRLSQEVHGQTWRYLGEYYLEAGQGGRVTLLSQSSDPGQAVIADAIRFGGGLGSVPGPQGPSNQPRWEEQSTLWARYQGASTAVCGEDVTCRPRYAEWETAKGYPGEAGKAVFVSWHTNAGGGTGTESYVHNSQPTPGSSQLQSAIHTELIRDLRAAWDPGWVDRGRKSADFGELRELDTIPGVLLEVAFHDSESPGDVDDLREPLFRQIAARAVYQGIVKYHAARAGSPVALLPEPPARLVARNTAPGQVTLSWTPPACCNGVLGDAATSYKVYQSSSGRAYDNGTETAGTSLTLTGVPANALRFFRVTALNAGGESFPTAVVAVRTPPPGKATPLLIVDGFDRLDQAALIPQWEGGALGSPRRMFLERMNRYDYAVEHGLALAGCGVAFDGAVNEAVEAGDLALAGYAAVDWFVGEDATEDVALSAAELACLRAYLEGGGRLLLSGADIGYDLVQNGRDPVFFRGYLHAGYLGNDAGTYSFYGPAGGLFSGLTGAIDDGNGGTYDVDQPDRLAAVGGAVETLSYTGGAGGAAAVAYAGPFRTVYLGFPLESVVDAGARQALACTAAEFLLEGAVPEPQCMPRLINSGFEGGPGQTAWEVSAPVGVPVLVHHSVLPEGFAPHGGDWLAWLGGYSPGATVAASARQVVALPAGDGIVRLSLAWRVEAGAADQAAGGDTLSVELADQGGGLLHTLLTLTASSPAGLWQVAEFDLSAFAGQTVQVVFRAASAATAFFIDDVQLTTCGLPGADEFRALWVDAYHPGAKSQAEIDELVETLQAGNFNAVVVQVRRRGTTYYPSTIDPWADDADRSFNALAYLIQRAHAAGIEVHAWAPTLTIWEDLAAAPPGGHAFAQHGLGSEGRDYWLMTGDAGQERTGDGLYYLDPGHPDVVDYLASVYAELATGYDLDGLHLDRVRYPGGAWGYNPTSLVRFQAQTGRPGRPDPQDPQWLQWRRDQVTALVRRIYLTVTAANPQLRVSAALSAAGAPPGGEADWPSTVPYTQHLQDWPGWLAEGIVDLALPMTYRDQDLRAAEFDGWLAWEKDLAHSRSVVVGTGLYLNSVENSMAQWGRVRQAELTSPANRLLGLCGYSYAVPSDEGAPRRTLVNAALAGPLGRVAQAPAVPWKDWPTLGYLMGTVAQATPCFSLDGYRLVLTGPQQRALVTDGSGWFGAVDLPPGEYSIVPTLLRNPTPIPLTVTAGAVSQVPIFLSGCPAVPARDYLPAVVR